MRCSTLGLCAAFTLTIPCSAAMATDLAKVERKIGKEPKYDSPVPYYCLLLFGLEAKRAWLVVDGDAIYLDRNGNADLTDDGGKTVIGVNECDLGVIETKSKKYKIQAIRSVERWVLHVTMGEYIMASGPTTFLTLAAKAPIIHFDGPLEFFPRHDRAVFDRSRLGLSLGTKGIGENSVAKMPINFPPKDAHPKAKVIFQTDDKKEVTVDVDLDGRCCGYCFHGAVSIPQNALEGKIKVIVSYSAWKEGKVKESRFDMPFELQKFEKP